MLCLEKFRYDSFLAATIPVARLSSSGWSLDKDSRRANLSRSSSSIIRITIQSCRNYYCPIVRNEAGFVNFVPDVAWVSFLRKLLTQKRPCSHMTFFSSEHRPRHEPHSLPALSFPAHEFVGADAPCVIETGEPVGGVDAADESRPLSRPCTSHPPML